MKSLVSLLSRHAALAAMLLFAGTAVFAGRIDGYSHAQHPLALLGASPLPHAWIFNLLAFVVPGLLLAWGALRLREALPAGADGTTPWSGRVGAQLMLVSALAFAAQGVLPLDAGDLEGVRSARHAAAWMVWWIAFAAGGLLLALGLRGHVLRWRGIAASSLLAALLLPVLALLLPMLVPAGSAQRLAFALWFLWALQTARVVNRVLQP
ncbi:DUF998 domain-containing protein [Lysobacter sp. Root494]|uniref:DUF998 domain-containing protein n=1 Tax=Lysobacter sp. Root494 TaxID=1736549 RepID=UPI0006FAA0F3|nr:DUF998 domain-containing protein [Lysobacter sp. Root494]KQY51953.1 hypothetical protein ASD14_04575 [Lysobacter sp. Root494]